MEFLGTGLPSACRGHRKGPVLFKRCQVQQDPHGEVWGAFSGGSCHDYVYPSFWRCLSPLCLCVSPCVFCLGVHLIQRPLPLFMSCLSRLPLCLLLSAVPAFTLSFSHIHSLLFLSLSCALPHSLSFLVLALALSLTSSALPFSQAGSLSSALRTSMGGILGREGVSEVHRPCRAPGTL